ncbi:hypothetical protein TRVL_09210 [Trypanosoma vivax]|nr:hypothetical protein TRVL_09210 [Trypanosoma vivax]
MVWGKTQHDEIRKAATYRTQRNMNSSRHRHKKRSRFGRNIEWKQQRHMTPHAHTDTIEGGARQTATQLTYRYTRMQKQSRPQRACVPRTRTATQQGAWQQRSGWSPQRSCGTGSFSRPAKKSPLLGFAGHHSCARPTLLADLCSAAQH